MTDRVKALVVLLIFAILFLGLTISGYIQKSATADEPNHLTAGYTKLMLHDYRLHLENPPLIQKWAALPLLLMRDIHLNTNTAFWQPGRLEGFAHQFLYERNDADRLLYRARFMIVLLGLLLGVLVFSWARELFGIWPATVVLCLYLLEPNFLAHSSLVTTDLGVTCFVFGTLYFAWRTLQTISLRNVAGLSVFFALAQVSKFSAVLLYPILALLLVLRVLRHDQWPAEWQQLMTATQKLRAALGIVLIVSACTWVTIWAAYDFRYTLTADERLILVPDREALNRATLTMQVANWIDKNQLLPNAYVQGFLMAPVVTEQKWTGYLLGQISDEGWWYYFPIVFLIKTPIAHLLLFAAGVVWCAARRDYWWSPATFAGLPILFIFGSAMMGKLDLGLRHVLPAYPFILIIAGVAVNELLRRRTLRIIQLLLLGTGLLAVGELALIYPHYLAFFNQFVGGASRGHYYLLDSNLDWGQDLKALKLWADVHHVEHVNLSYFGSADPAYYRIHCTYLAGSPSFASALISNPKLPGYVAISLQNLHGVNLPKPIRNYYQPLLDRQPVAAIGHSIQVYWVETNGWANKFR